MIRKLRKGQLKLIWDKISKQSSLVIQYSKEPFFLFFLIWKKFLLRTVGVYYRLLYRLYCIVRALFIIKTIKKMIFNRDYFMIKYKGHRVCFAAKLIFNIQRMCIQFSSRQYCLSSYLFFKKYQSSSIHFKVCVHLVVRECTATQYFDMLI